MSIQTLHCNQNCILLCHIITSLLFLNLSLLLFDLLLLAGDVHPRQLVGPYSLPHFLFPLLSQMIATTSCLSILQYNVQSIANKMDILKTEFNVFDCLAFTETWLSTNNNTSTLVIPTFHNPERVDRHLEGYGFNYVCERHM